ncbi:cyclic peptide export ABC transporter [Mycobacterium sp. KBS0706]|uniref:cyclic peptide export ABC transporter n=1 Tax=Mycobacterium sp. KBS0706 TaxID=2578109 RepID=UPI00110FC6A7|nr:cyclic peptide export ABC transporter [Mycobacterium sp. KBS0706]TSD83433.1 cyclic peptide export ABC transporter [Mycobacterium sp. KBS0706]
MPLITILRSIAARNLRRIALMAVVAGLSNAAVLALINMAADRQSSSTDGGGSGSTVVLALMFVGVVLMYTFSQRFLMFEAAREVESLIHRIRTRLIEAVRHSELADIEHIGRTRIYNGLSKEIQTLAQSSATLALIFQMSMLVLFTMAYLAFLSMTAFLLAIGFIGVAIVLYLGRAKHASKAVQEATEAEYGLDVLVTGILEGFKEVKLNARRSGELLEDLVKASRQASDQRIKAHLGFAQNLIFSQNIFFLLLGTMVFVVPALSSATAYSDTLLKTTTVILFVIGPLGGLVGSVPILANANTAAAHLLELERLLEESAGPKEDWDGQAAGPAPSFQRIELRGVTFHFEETPGQYAFQVGPVDLTIQAGETIFISGGNGSGKSTLLRLLTALYLPQLGTISVDGRPVTHANAASYRALFSAVFSDFHLFKRTYGVDPEAVAEVDELLRLFEIDAKTGVAGDAFTTVDLSAGQRKRLALIVAVLERRPICILDEWAADQDPHFRQKFYDELLRMLKDRAITVIAVTHDDRYYDRADRRLHMEEGRIVSVGPENVDA